MTSKESKCSGYGIRGEIVSDVEITNIIVHPNLEVELEPACSLKSQEVDKLIDRHRFVSTIGLNNISPINWS